MRKDSGIGDDDRHVIYASDIQISILGKAEVLVVDGTFKNVPHGFCQLVTIMGKFYVCCHGLLKIKQKDVTIYFPIR